MKMVVALLGVTSEAAAETVIEADAAANAGYSDTSAEHGRRGFTEIRPGLSLQLDSPRVTSRARYVFAGTLAFGDERSRSYSNAVDLSLAAELTSRSSLRLDGAVIQGKTEFKLTQRAPETGEPAFRTRQDTDLLTATLAESYVFQWSPRLRLGQALTGGLVAPRSTLGTPNAVATGSIYLDRLGDRDAIGVELRSSGASLRRETFEGVPYWNLRNALLGRWDHEFSWSWSAQASAGLEHVLTFADSYPLAVLPTGSVTALYTSRDAGAALTATYGSAVDLQTGTVSLSQGILARMFVSFDGEHHRQLAGSAGFLHAEPLGESSARAAAGTGNVVQGDVGLLWGFSDEMLGTVRYSLAYQFDQVGGLGPLLTQALLFGITVRYSSAPRKPPVPSFGPHGRDPSPDPGPSERRGPGAERSGGDDGS